MRYILYKYLTLKIICFASIKINRIFKIIKLLKYMILKLVLIKIANSYSIVKITIVFTSNTFIIPWSFLHYNYCWYSYLRRTWWSNNYSPKQDYGYFYPHIWSNT